MDCRFERRMIMKGSRWKIVVSSIIIGLPVLIEAILMNMFPEKVQSLGGLSNNEILIASGAIMLFMLLAHLFCIMITAKDKYNKAQNETILNVTLWVVPITSLLVMGMLLKAIFNMSFDVYFIMSVLFALMFIVLGNYLPKCRRNQTIGIKVSWALDNDENWHATHRFAGKVWVATGLLWLFISFLPVNSFLVMVIVIVPLLVLMPAAYSYMYYKKQLDEGTYKEAGDIKTGKKSKYAVIMIIVTLVIVVPLLFEGSVGVEFDSSEFEIKTTFWKNMTIKYDEIESVEYLEQYDKGSREFGYGSFTIGAGAFTSGEFGDYTLFAYLNTKQGVCIKVKGETVVVSLEDEAATKDMYEELESHVRNLLTN